MPEKNSTAAAAAALLILTGSLGCTMTRPHAGPRVCWPGVPREHALTSLPDYTVEPPDVLTIEAVNLTPRAPYLLRPLDVLQVQATGVPASAPLSSATGEYRIGVDGTLVLGGGYDMTTDENGGKRYAPLRVAGLPVEAARELIQLRLESVARSPNVWVSLVELAPFQGVNGEHLVGPDGTINLGAYGRLRVVGMTVDEVRALVQTHLSTWFNQPSVAVDVFGYNSKVYYVVTQGAGLGDQILQFPVTGKETALDAISQVQGTQAFSSTRMWIARPGGNEVGGDQILPVDWQGITQRGDTLTNYQVLPGDRLFIAEDKRVALDTRLAKIIAPLERVVGFTLLTTQTARLINFFNDPTAGGFGGGI